MFEAILTSGGSPLKEYPDSGPGVKTLKYGNEDLGYFGEVSQSELFTLQELRREFNFYSGADAPGFNWIKMFLDGKVIFFPIARIASLLSWADIYSSGLIYGTDDNGVVPQAIPVNQYRLISKDVSTFKVRTFKGATDDPTTITGPITVSVSTPKLLESECMKVFAALSTGTVSGYTGPRFQLYASALFSAMYCQNSRADSPASYCMYYNQVVANVYGKTQAGYGWQPVLELIPFDEVPLLPVKEMVAGGSLAGGLAVGKEPTFVDEVLPIIRQLNTSTFPLEAYGEIELVGEYPVQISPPSLRVTVSVPHMAVGLPPKYE